MRYSKNSYDLKVERQNYKHTEKREKFLIKRSDAVFHLNDTWNLDATGSIAIPLLLLFNSVALVNA
jgi:hypothetical protein